MGASSFGGLGLPVGVRSSTVFLLGVWALHSWGMPGEDPQIHVGVKQGKTKHSLRLRAFGFKVFCLPRC